VGRAGLGELWAAGRFCRAAGQAWAAAVSAGAGDAAVAAAAGRYEQAYQGLCRAVQVYCGVDQVTGAVADDDCDGV